MYKKGSNASIDLIIWINLKLTQAKPIAYYAFDA
jgi:hypothetical protein